MASLTAGTTFTDGVANDVTAAKLGALVTNATPTSGFIQDRTAETVVATDDTLLIGDASDSNNLKRMTVANLLKAPLVSTSGTVDNLTTGTTTSTAQIVTSSTFLGTITGSTNVVNIGSGQIYKDASGQVGIGTTSPATKLHVFTANPTAANEVARFQGGSNSSNFRNYISLYTTNPDYWWELSNQDANGAASTNGLAFRERSNAASVERVYIAQGGNVGIGTPIPTTKLHVYGAGSTATFYTNGDASGATLYLQDTGGSANNGGQILFGANVGIFAGIKGRLENGTGPAGTLTFQTRNTSGNVLERMFIDFDGSLALIGSYAQKASGTAWANPSDVRIKKNIRDYEKGLDSLMQVRVREWEYNGKAGAVADTKSMGVVADEIETILPDTVSTYKAKLNPEDEEDSDIKKFDATEITWLLVKAVQELSAKVTALEAA